MNAGRTIDKHKKRHNNKEIFEKKYVANKRPGIVVLVFLFALLIFIIVYNNI